MTDIQIYSHPKDLVLSVIVPVYNTEPYLRQCLESLVIQNMSNIEIICVDNGSTDGSLNILNEYASLHENIVVVVHPGGRQGSARNAGLEIASGDYIGFVDSDDYVSKEMFRLLYSLACSSGAEIAICNIELFYQATRQSRKGVSDYILESTNSYRVTERPLLLRNLTICNKIFSSALLERLNLRFPEDVFHEDQFFVVSAMLNARGIVSTPEALYHYRKEREGSVSNDHGRSTLDIFVVMDLLAEEIKRSVNARSLFNEIKITRLLQLYNTTQGCLRREYYLKMKTEFSSIVTTKNMELLTPTEYREYRVLRRYGYIISECFYRLRQLYGWFLSCRVS